MMDPFEVLGIAPQFDVDLRTVEERYRELSRVLHPDRHVGKPAAERRLALGKAVEVGQAVRMLRDPVSRASALLRRVGVRVDEGNEPKPAPEFLMELLELRESLAEARAKRDGEAVERLAQSIRQREQVVMNSLTKRFGPLTAVRSPGGSQHEPASELAAARELLPLLGELRYYRRFLEEVSSIQDDLLADAASSQASSGA